jgi:hypothetical protein
MPLAYGIMQQKRAIPDYGFETYCAPSSFDRESQPVDIYEKLNIYHKNRKNYRKGPKYIYSVMDSFTTNTRLSAGEMPVFGGTSYRYGYTSGGTDYEFDLPSSKYTGTTGNATASSLTVVSTDGFPDSGKVICGSINRQGWGGNPYFTYTSKDSTTFYGASQTFYRENNFLVSPVIAWTGTKRWVIVNYTGSSPMGYAVNYVQGPEWIFCSDLINYISVSDGYTSTASSVKYVHVSDLSTITRYVDGCGLNSKLTGILYLSPSTYEGEVGENTPGYFESRNVFANSVNITGITFCSAIKRISANAFSGCTGLTSLSFNDELEYIGPNAFYNCTSITGTLTIPSALTTIGEGAFAYTGFTAFDVSANSGYHVHDSVLYQESNHLAVHGLKGASGSLTIESDTVIIGNYCFAKNTSRTGTLTIPDNVTDVGAYSFLQDTGFTAISMGTSVVTLDTSAFQSCTNIISSVTLPSTLTTINADVFSGVPLSGTLNIPSSLTTFISGSGWTHQLVFNNLSAITGGSTNYPVEDNVIYDAKTSGQIKAVASAKAYSGTLTLKSGTTHLQGGCFYNCSGRTGDLHILSTITSITHYVFVGCTGFNGSLKIDSTAASAGDSNWYMQDSVGWTPNITALELCSGQLSTVLDWRRAPNLSGASTNQSILNIPDGTPSAHKKFYLGTTTGRDGSNNLARLLAVNPNAVTDAAARYIDVT